MMRTALLLLAACATESTPKPAHPDLLELAFTESVRSGDAIVAVPGTGTYTDLGVHIDASSDATIDGRTYVGAVEVLEGAIAVAERAGFSAPQIEAGEIELAIWGAGITKHAAFRYVSLDGLRVTFHVIGGTSVCAVGGIAQNLTNYNAGNADEDARDLYKRLQTWSAARPGAGRKITLVAHSWGGIVAEYLASNLASYVVDHDAIAGADVAFVVAGGVPSYVPKFAPHGPGFRTVASTDEDVHAAVRTYEIARPDDPARTFNPAGNGGGHHYIIRFGEDYRGWFGITTDELSCGDVPGICPDR